MIVAYLARIKTHHFSQTFSLTETIIFRLGKLLAYVSSCVCFTVYFTYLQKALSDVDYFCIFELSVNWLRI